MVTTRDLEMIARLVREVAENGFGEVRIIVVNGHVQRIVKSEDYFLAEKLMAQK